MSMKSHAAIAPSLLARIGAPVRRRAAFLLLMASLGLGVLREAALGDAWRRPVRAEFRRVLREAAGGGFSTIAVTAALIGLGLVSQAIYWLGEAGQEGIVGTVLVTVLVRELAPVLVGFVLLGRSGMVAIVELGAMQAGGQLRALQGMGLDPFRLLVLPRVAAFAVTGFTLGIIFVLIALLTGFVAGSLLGVVQLSLFGFLDAVLRAMGARDFLLFPGKLVMIGALVGLTSTISGLSARRGDSTATLLPRGFLRGVLAVLLCSALLSLAV
ncbi:MlaE family ABC transporter permease [Plastoroseomonas hellenica]|uniref:MlaE family ABC transporter permease n=1 Tax=Plastoroseomonas hellenica TaxID=2687306 RepID=UPI001BA4C30D|nr:ABC transporter permease [Plastoroseomonas hellenica]MBR0646422.1 ABC transporter permease [Plastoroseomonas hellenica]